MLFNYNTLQVNLCKDTRSIEVLINRPEQNHTINIEMLFELESLFGWLTSHIEVNAIVLSSTDGCDLFCGGFDQEELKIMSDEKLKKYLVRFQKLLHSLHHLPQSIICDLKAGANGMGFELALNCDIRVASRSSVVNFNQLAQGWTPCGGTVSILNQLVGHARARSWVLAGSKINGEAMLTSGLVLETYAQSVPVISGILNNILAQAPIARIQAKRGFLEAILPEMERGWEYESAFAFANLESEDWKRNSSEDFTKARDMGKKVKEELAPQN